MEIRILNSSVTKPSKATALRMVRELREKYIDSDLDDLLMYFADRPKGKVKTAEQWVCLAVAKKDIRVMLNYMYVEDNMAYGSDGHRMHTAPTELADGFYDPASRTLVDVDPKYVDANRVLTPPSNVYGNVAKVSELERYEKQSKVYRRHTGCDRHISEKYLLEATNGDQNACVTAYDDRWYGESEFGKFVIMGIRR